MSEPLNVLVSGGSRGLGLAIVSHLLGRGHRVATFARSRTDELDALQSNHPDALVVGELDARDDARVSNFLAEADRELGGLTALINNAAVGQDSLLAHSSPETVRRILSTNLEAPLLLTRLFVRLALGAGRTGRVVMVTSIAAQQGYAGLTIYSATKGALESFTRSLARELGGRVIINSIAPGFFESEMSSVLNPDQLATIVRRTPTGTLTTSEMLLPVVDLLLDENTNINGQVIAVDGGATA